MELKAENITFSYHKNKPILKDISLSLNSNQIIGLMGDSGSGKSTLCKVMAGYITHYTGKVTIDGNDVDRKGFDPIQLIFQHPEKTMNPKWKMQKVLTESSHAREPFEIIVVLGKPVDNNSDPSHRELINQTLKPWHSRIVFYTELIENAYNAYNEYIQANRQTQKLVDLMQQLEAEKAED